MSGGVDSSVAAYLLKEQGYDVIGVTMQIWQDDATEAAENGCCGISAVDDARRVSGQLDIPYYVMNFKNEFKCNVIDYFVDEYKKGRTPNPCIACNLVGFRSYSNNKCRLSKSKSKTFSLTNCVVYDTLMSSNYIAIDVNEITGNRSIACFTCYKACIVIIRNKAYFHTVRLLGNSNTNLRCNFTDLILSIITNRKKCV